MKNLFFVFILLIIVSCQKEQEKTLQDYIGTYNIESTSIKFQYNDFGICYTGMDSNEAHIADSINSLAPDFYLDTIYRSHKVEILQSKYSQKELAIQNLLGMNELLHFYNPDNTKEFKFVRLNDDEHNTFRAAYHNSSLKENEIDFDFEIFGDYTTFTFSGLAKN